MNRPMFVCCTCCGSGTHTGAGPCCASFHDPYVAAYSCWCSSNGCSGLSTCLQTCCHACRLVGCVEVAVDVQQGHVGEQLSKAARGGWLQGCCVQQYLGWGQGAISELALDICEQRALVWREGGRCVSAGRHVLHS